MSSLAGKVIIITGASSGIGRATAVEAARLGALLSLGSRNGDRLAEVAAECSSLGNEVIFTITDVANETDCKRLIDKTVDRFGRIDVLINNAGISMRALFIKTDLLVLDRVMNTNFWGTVYCTKYALPHLLKTKGSLVGVSSIAGYKGLPGRSGYSASKFAIQGFLEVIRIEHLPDHLHVLIACPGFTSSNIRNVALDAAGRQQGESPRDEQKMMKSETVAKHLLHAIEKRKRTLTLTWEGKLTVILNKIFPGWLDRIVFNQMAKEPDSPLGHYRK